MGTACPSVSPSLGLGLPRAEAASPLSVPRVPVSPSLSLLICFLPLPSRPLAHSLSLCRSAAPVPRPCAAPPHATAPSGLPPHWLRPGVRARVTAPCRAPCSPASWSCGPRRLREGTGWGCRRPPPDVAGSLGRADARARGWLAPRPDGLHRELGVLRGAGARASLQPPGPGEPPGPRAAQVPGAPGLGPRREQAATASGRAPRGVGGGQSPAHLRGKEPRRESAGQRSGGSGAKTR